ncbi:hypothetical protein MAR_006084 [Mya arenaria]|uniref:Uncharacterized protein n=1 Tax=Mya arenaria TaxID=6604 RepID=A0ABY7DC03_MYAAR|nr:hypothetical protein MAR_006084 [Mya arenaria]
MTYSLHCNKQLSKHFHTVFEKGKSYLNKYGVRSNIPNWIDSFLVNCRQRVVVNGEIADLLTVQSGVPKGTKSYLNKYGVRSNIPNWIDSFLVNCRQRVVVNGEIADLLTVHPYKFGTVILFPDITYISGGIASHITQFANECVCNQEILSTVGCLELKGYNKLGGWATQLGMRF